MAFRTVPGQRRTAAGHIVSARRRASIYRAIIGALAFLMLAALALWPREDRAEEAPYAVQPLEDDFCDEGQRTDCLSRNFTLDELARFYDLPAEARAHLSRTREGEIVFVPGGK